MNVVIEATACDMHVPSSAVEVVRTLGQEDGAASKPKVRISFHPSLSPVTSSKKRAHPRPRGQSGAQDEEYLSWVAMNVLEIVNSSR